MKKLLLFCVLISALSSCAHVISAENREHALSAVSLNEVRAHPDQYAEKTFIFGGIIADAFNIEDGTEIEIVQLPLDEWGYVIAHDRSEGRFIVTAKNHLDPVIFSKGREITISGVLIGTRTEKLRNKDYNYPLFRAKEIHLLPRKMHYYYPYTDHGFEPFYYPSYYPGYWGYYPFIYPSLHFRIR